MRKFVTLLIVLFCFSLFQTAFAQGDAERVAKEVLKAYKEKNLDLLKKYLTGIVVCAVNDGFFDSDDGAPLVEMANSWDGEIREIRYSSGDLMGREISIANVYFGDNPNGNLNVVILSSMEGSDWKAFAFGVTDMSEEEFNEGSLTLNEEVEEVEEVEADAEVGMEEFSVEMASGEEYVKPTVDKLKASLKSLDDDNFFLILSSNDGFIQTSTSEKGFIVQHNHGKGMFEAEAYFTFDELVEIFTAYLKKGDWKSKAKWITM